MKIAISIPNIPQNHRSANCGPCTLKMVLDYYNVRNSDGRPHSLLSINRLLRVTHEYGCEKKDFYRVLKRFDLPYRKIPFEDIEKMIKQNIPVIALYFDEDQMGHYSLLIGYTKEKFILNDPWHPRKYRYFKKEFRRMLRPFDDWLIAVSSTIRSFRRADSSNSRPA